MTDDEEPTATDEDLIESESPSTRGSEIRRRVTVLVPPMVGRKVLGGTAVAALALGLVAGFLVGSGSAPEPTVQSGIQEGAPPDGNYIPIVPDGSPLQGEYVVFTVDADLLNVADLLAAGEATASVGGYGLDVASGLEGLCGVARRPVPVPAPDDITVQDILGATSFILDGATLTERVGPDLNVLSASTLRATIELLRNCSSPDGMTVQTDGIQTGIGDEYVVFTVVRPDPVSRATAISIVVQVRVGGQLLEVSLIPDGGTEVPDGLARALRIAEAAVARLEAA